MGDMKKLQRRLIPVNIVVAVLAIIAAISLIFAPLVTINFGKLATALIETQDADNPDNSESSDSFDISAIIKSVENFKLSVSTYTVAKLAFSEQPMDIIVDTVATEIEKVQDDIIATVVTEILPAVVAESDLDIDTDKIDVKDIMNKIDSALTADEAERSEAK